MLLKGMLRRGVLQGTEGLSIAFEAGLLVPGDTGERAGFEGMGDTSPDWSLTLGWTFSFPRR